MDNVPRRYSRAGPFPNSIRSRRSLQFCVVAALVFIGAGVLFLMFTGNKDAQATRARITHAVEGLLPVIREGPVPAVLPGGDDLAIQVLDPRGRTVGASPRLLGHPPMAAFPATGHPVHAEQVLCPPAGLRGCMIVDSYKVDRPDGVWLLHVAVPQSPWYGSTTVLAFVAGASLLVTAAVAAGTFRLVNRDMTAIDAIREELAEINAADLDRRVPLAAPNQEEISLLAVTVNDTLDRLEQAYNQLRRFTADASHDLRSPLTAVRTRLEDALAYPQDTDWPEMTAAVLAGVDRLQAIVTDLLTLARLDARAPLTPERTDLTRLVDTELDRRPRRVAVVKDLQPDVVADCDPLRIARLLINLVDNAERHAASRVTVSVRADESAVTLEVLDDGAGIAAEDREVVFTRFARLDAARNRDAGGTGLGLAIAREIAEAHGGTLTIRDSDRGARFVLRLPR
uniref:sensor histidine kinase n=1 Tax=Herbidospora sakaeratensis TaxID=564415 RepID=UPI000781F34F|nr:HAMP domain-containing sensor histidine kinase [Herbidospora sakaeratensis]